MRCESTANRLPWRSAWRCHFPVPPPAGSLRARSACVPARAARQQVAPPAAAHRSEGLANLVLPMQWASRKPALKPWPRSELLVEYVGRKNSLQPSVLQSRMQRMRETDVWSIARELQFLRRLASSYWPGLARAIAGNAGNQANRQNNRQDSTLTTQVSPGTLSRSFSDEENRMAKLALIYGMRLLPEEDLGEVRDATVILKNGDRKSTRL